MRSLEHELLCQHRLSCTCTWLRQCRHKCMATSFAADHDRGGMFAVDFGRSPCGTVNYTLPWEVSLMIFRDLDRKSLTRCAFICTSWYSLVSREKTLWLYHFERRTGLPWHIVTSALNQFPVPVRKGPICRSERDSEASQQSTLADRESADCRSAYESAAVITENVLELAVVQHRGILHRVFASIGWLCELSPENTFNVSKTSKPITLDADSKTPQKVGRNMVMLKDLHSGLSTFHQLDSASMQLVHKEYRVPLNIDPSTYVMEFLPQSKYSVDEVTPTEVELVSAPFAELVVCVVRKWKCDVATHILWYDPDSLSIVAECDINGKVSEHDVCIFCQFCGLVVFFGCGDTSHSCDKCRAPHVTVWSPHTPAAPIQLSATPFCPSNDRRVCSFLAGRQEGACAAMHVHAQTTTRLCSVHRIVQCLIEDYTATEMYSAVLTTQTEDNAKWIETSEEYSDKLSFHWRPPNLDDSIFDDDDPLPLDHLSAVLSPDNLILSLYGIAFYDDGLESEVEPELLADVDVSLQSFSTPYFRPYSPPRPARMIVYSYHSVYIGGPTHTVSMYGDGMTMYSTVYGKEVMRISSTASDSTVFLWDYDILSRLPRPEGLLSESPLFMECTKQATPPPKRMKAIATVQ